MHAPESQPLCESCWIEQNAVTAADAETDTPVIVHVPMPTRAMLIGLEVCCHCGFPTISGIYVRRDPAKVPYPTLDDGDEEPARPVKLSA